MSRTLKLVLLAAIVETTLVALAVIVWRWDTVAALPPHARTRPIIGAFAMLSFPAWLGLASWVIAYKMARPGLTTAPDTRRYNETTYMAMAAFAVGVQAWTLGTVLGVVPKGEISIRAIEALTGVFMIVAGNFAAKTSPPTGPGAPDPAVYARGALRIGWISVAAGFVVLVASITVAIKPMIWIIFAAAASCAIATWLQRRAMRRKPA